MYRLWIKYGRYLEVNIYINAQKAFSNLIERSKGNNAWLEYIAN